MGVLAESEMKLCGVIQDDFGRGVRLGVEMGGDVGDGMAQMVVEMHCGRKEKSGTRSRFGRRSCWERRGTRRWRRREERAGAGAGAGKQCI